MSMAPPPEVAHADLEAVERLGRIAAALRGTPDGDWFDAVFGRYVAGAAAGLKFDEAVGLARRPGEEPWWPKLKRAERDDAIRRLATTFPGAPSARALAAAEAIRGYAGVGWRHDRARGAPLTSDARRQLLFTIFKADEDPPTSMRRIYDILSVG
jgi:hypothetical protein